MFFFSHSVFYNFGQLSAIFIDTEIVVCKLSHFGRVYDLSFRKALNLKLMTKILEWAMLRALADKLKYLDRIGNIIGKGANAGSHSVFQSFLSFLSNFKLSSANTFRI